ncbi:uncharacterized protein N7483_006312 [Penicillium malachiteum]|uniref:uncharacterized protein n=1 Tax=Penicillium malachiteum TaxID=1324776 RepID=UPI00254912E4|nr:uncharacterized protein N7483_006312 [Penicillium malachiteum]KAJ5731804.1 hypothetical protein N7483_006312 [Penicillium malachiteum]
MEERHRLESQQSKKTEMLATPESCLPINININGMQNFPQSEAFDSIAAPERPLPPNTQGQSDLKIVGPWDASVREFTAWHEANVSDKNLKEQFRQACNVALANGLDLKLIYQDQDPSFFTNQGIMVGIA